MPKLSLPALDAAGPVRVVAPWGKLHLDRPLPWLGLTRIPELATSDRTLIEGWPAYLLYSAHPSTNESRSTDLNDAACDVLEQVASDRLERFRAFLVIELVVRPQHLGRSCLRVQGPRPHGSVLRGLLEGLHAIRRLGDVPDHQIQETSSPEGPPAPLGDFDRTYWVTLDLDPIHFDRETGRPYPMVVRALEIALDGSVREACYRFARHHTSLLVPSPAAAGRRHLLPEEWSTDRALARINESYDFLLNITPINSNEAWHEFSASGFERAPRLRYRPVDVDPEELRRTLFQIPIHHTEDPIVAQLFRAEQEGIDQKLRMLEQRDTPRFIFDSLHLYGMVDDDLLDSALHILDTLTSDPPATPERTLAAPAFARLAERQIGAYREELPSLTARVELRDDIASVMVSHGNLLVPRTAQIRLSRVEGLLAHEVGTHIVTYFNGRAQRLKLLAAGLSRSDELQEGLAVLAEGLTGELSEARLRLLAARVLAVHRLTRGATFVDVFRELTQEHDFGARTAFDVALRVFRGGGFTKDAIYLRGLRTLLDYLAAGQRLEVLLIGKLAFGHVPLVEQLLERGVLEPPALIPHYLRHGEAERLVSELKQGQRLQRLIRRRAA